MKPQFEVFDDNNLKHCDNGTWWSEDSIWSFDDMWYVNRDEYREAQNDLSAIAE